jgi:hypothetical protein
MMENRWDWKACSRAPGRYYSLILVFSTLLERGRWEKAASFLQGK